MRRRGRTIYYLCDTKFSIATQHEDQKRGKCSEIKVFMFFEKVFVLICLKVHILSGFKPIFGELYLVWTWTMKYGVSYQVN